MKKLLSFLILILVSATFCLAQNTNKTNIYSKVGVVDAKGQDSICLQTKNANLVKNTPVSIVIRVDKKPQKVLSAIVEKRLKESCLRDHAEGGDDYEGKDYYYSLKLKKKLADEYEMIFGIGVIQPTKAIKVKNKLASVDLNGDGRLEYFRSCTTNEGGNFTIWTGKPLQGKRIWLSYYYVDYGTEADCKKKDYEGSN
ncbi:MAG: hypothetical protein AAB336_04170 [Acidobacteriota bacterium]